VTITVEEDTFHTVVVTMPPRQQVGTLTVLSDPPGAVVREGGQLLGGTPLTLVGPSRPHTLKFFWTDGRQAQRKVTVRARTDGEIVGSPEP
jgi:hypothetical protein